MNKDVVILGTSGFAIELAAVVRQAGRVVAGFLGPQNPGGLPAPYLGTDDVLSTIGPRAGILVAVGNPTLRRRIFDTLSSAAGRVETFISPQAYVADDAVIESGCIIYPNATVHGRAFLGRGVLVNSNASVGHETRVGAFSNVGPGVALGGRCVIGDEVYLGIGSVMIEERNVASGTVLGAGAVVVHNIERAGTYVGVPARMIG